MKYFYWNSIILSESHKRLKQFNDTRFFFFVAATGIFVAMRRFWRKIDALFNLFCGAGHVAHVAARGGLAAMNYSSPRDI